MWKIKDPELKAKVNQFFTDEEIHEEFEKNTDLYSYFRLSTVNKKGLCVTITVEKELVEFVPENHPFYGKNSSEIEGDIEVHGGLTFSGKMKDSDDYWFGWDYAHVGDHTYISGLLFDTEKAGQLKKLPMNVST